MSSESAGSEDSVQYNMDTLDGLLAARNMEPLMTGKTIDQQIFKDNSKITGEMLKELQFSRCLEKQKCIFYKDDAHRRSGLMEFDPSVLCDDLDQRPSTKVSKNMQDPKKQHLRKGE